MLTIIPRDKLPHERYFRVVDDQDVREALTLTSIRRHQSNVNGAGKSKSGTLWSESAIPGAIYWGKLEDEYLKRCARDGIKPDKITQMKFAEVDRELKRGFRNPDPMEREKFHRAFREEYSKFKTR